MKDVILVTGSREWWDAGLVREMIYLASHLCDGRPSVLHGGARGAEFIAGQFCDAVGWPEIVRPARWDEHGEAAGPIRNREMIEEFGSRIAVACAFVRYDLPCRWTRDMLELLIQTGVPVLVVSGGPMP